MRVRSLISSNHVDLDLTRAGELEVTISDDREDESWGERLSRDDTRELYLRLDRVFAPPTRRERRALRRRDREIRYLEDAIADERHWLGVWEPHFGTRPSDVRSHRERLDRLERELDTVSAGRV